MPSPPNVLAVIRQSHLEFSGQQEDYTSTATTFWLVVFDADCFSSIYAEGATDGTTTVPVRQVPHPEAPGRLCNRTEARTVEGNTRRYWVVRCEYSDEYQTPLNPLSAPPQIEWDFTQADEQPYFLDCTPGSGDSNGSSGSQSSTSTSGPKRVTNSAGELFQDYLTRSQGSVTATYAVNLTPSAARSMVATIVTYTDPVPAINSDSVTFDGEAVGVGQMRIKGANLSALQKENGVSYRTLKFTFEFRVSFDDKIDDRGFNILESSSNSDGSTTSMLKEITKSVPPVKVDRPYPLNGSGGLAASADAAPAILTFKPYPQKPYAVFGLT